MGMGVGGGPGLRAMPGQASPGSRFSSLLSHIPTSLPSILPFISSPPSSPLPLLPPLSLFQHCLHSLGHFPEHLLCQALMGSQREGKPSSYPNHRYER